MPIKIWSNHPFFFNNEIAISLDFSQSTNSFSKMSQSMICLYNEFHSVSLERPSWCVGPKCQWKLCYTVDLLPTLFRYLSSSKTLSYIYHYAPVIRHLGNLSRVVYLTSHGLFAIKSSSLYYLTLESFFKYTWKLLKGNGTNIYGSHLSTLTRFQFLSPLPPFFQCFLKCFFKLKSWSILANNIIILNITKNN